MECRRAYQKKYREDHREYLTERDKERYKKEHPNYIPNGNILARQEAIDLYYSNPKICKECGRILILKPREKISQINKRNFCDRKCSSVFVGKKLRTGCHCKICGDVFYRTEDYKSHKYCPSCAERVKRPISIGQLTKDELFARRSNWQSARSSIRRDAETIYDKSGRPKFCAVCRYSRYIEVAHLKEVKSA
jgi:hypothetical protein